MAFHICSIHTYGYILQVAVAGECGKNAAHPKHNQALASAQARKSVGAMDSVSQRAPQNARNFEKGQEPLVQSPSRLCILHMASDD